MALEIYGDNVFWEQKIFQDFVVLPGTFHNTTLLSAQRYVQFYTRNGVVMKGSEKFIKWNKFVKRIILQDKLHLVQHAIDGGFNNWKLLIRKYAAKGNICVKSYLTLYPHYQAALEGALEGGNKKLFDELTEITP